MVVWWCVCSNVILMVTEYRFPRRSMSETLHESFTVLVLTSFFCSLYKLRRLLISISFVICIGVRIRPIVFRSVISG